MDIPKAIPSYRCASCLRIPNLLIRHVMMSAINKDFPIPHTFYFPGVSGKVRNHLFCSSDVWRAKFFFTRFLWVFRKHCFHDLVYMKGERKN